MKDVDLLIGAVVLYFLAWLIVQKVKKRGVRRADYIFGFIFVSVAGGMISVFLEQYMSVVASRIIGALVLAWIAVINRSAINRAGLSWLKKMEGEK